MNKTKVYSAAKGRLNGRMYLHLFSHTSDDCPEGRRSVRTCRYGLRGMKTRPGYRWADLLNKTIGNRCYDRHNHKTNRAKDINEPPNTQVVKN